MFRTALVSIVAILIGVTAISWLTHDLQVWTDEGARRLEVALHPLDAPAVAIEGPEVSAHTLPELLTAHDGVTVADFFYTSCESICLSLGSSFQQMQVELLADAAKDPDGAGRVRLLSISFDHATDNLPTLAGYAQGLDAQPDLWRFVRVPDGAQEKQLLHDYGVVVIPDGRGDYEHNAALLVFDDQGRMVRIFDLEERELALNYARHLARQQAANTAPKVNGTASNTTHQPVAPATLEQAG